MDGESSKTVSVPVRERICARASSAFIIGSRTYLAEFQGGVLEIHAIFC